MALLKGTRILLGVSILLQIVAGNAFFFPLISTSLKSALGCTELRFKFLIFCNSIGQSSGVFAAVAIKKWPPWVLVLIGALSGFVGYEILWLAVTQTIKSIPRWILYVGLINAANSRTWLATAILETNVRNFPHSRGPISRILRGYGVLSTAVFTELYSMVLDNSASNLLLFLAVGIPVLCVMLVYFVKPNRPASKSDSTQDRYFVYIQGVCISLSVYLLFLIVLNNVLSPSAPMSYAFFAITVVLVMAPFPNLVQTTLLGTNRRKVRKLLPLSITTRHEIFPEGSKILEKGEAGFTLRRACVNLKFWMLFGLNFIVAGTWLTLVNKLIQMRSAQDLSFTTDLLSIFSIGSFVGGFCANIFSEYYARLRNMFWTVLKALSAVMALVGIMFPLVADKEAVYAYAWVFVMGICLEYQSSVMAALAREYFGPKNCNVIWKIISLGGLVHLLVSDGPYLVISL